jgi:hypothetical protein
MKLQRQLSLGLLLLALTSVQAQNLVTIDFENLSDGELVREQFLPVGLRVSGAGAVSGRILRIGEAGVEPFGNSGTNVMNVGNRGEPTTLAFVDPDSPTNIIGARRVSFLMGDGDTVSETFSVTFYGVNGDTILSGPTVYTTTTNGLRIEATSDALGALIGRVTINLLPSSDSGVTLDDLSFELARLVGPIMTIRVSEVEVCWTSETNATYRVEYRSDLTTSTWTTLRECVPSTGTETCIYDKVLRGQPQRFYRVAVTNCVPGF